MLMELKTKGQAVLHSDLDFRVKHDINKYALIYK